MAENLAGALWRKSSRSGSTGSCVEVGPLPNVVGVRDSKDPGGPELPFSPAAWATFNRDVKAGSYDLS